MTSFLAALLSKLRLLGTARDAASTASSASMQGRRALHERIARAVRAGDLPDLGRASRELLAIDPNDESAAKNVAIVELLSGNVAAARAALRSCSGTSAMRVATESLMDPMRARAESAYVAVLENVDVETAQWSILDGEKVYNAEANSRALVTNPFVQGRASPDRKSFLFALPAVSRTVEEPCIHLGGDDNYSHWVQRNLLKLALLEGNPHENLPLLVTEDLTAFQREYLQMLRVPESRLIKVPRPAVVHCRTLVVPTTLVYNPELARGVRWLRRRLAAWMDTGPPRELLYLSRTDARKRRLVNEDDLLRRLVQLGFHAITPGELTVAEQIREASQARVIVGAHGAGFANLVFAPADAAVVEINTAAKQHMTDHELLAQAVGLRRMSVISSHYDFTRPEPYAADADFRVDVDEVLGALRQLEG